MGLAACAEPISTKAKPDKKDDDGGGGANDDDDGNGNGTNTAVDDATDDTADDGTDDTEVLDDTNPDQSVEQLLAECGGGEATNATADQVIYEKTLKSLPLVINKVVVAVTIETTLKLKVTGAKSEQDALASVTKVTGVGFLANFAKTEAEKQAAASSGKVTYTNVPFKEYVNLGDKPGWDNVLCTFVPATAVENKRGGKTTVATFDPPLPASVSPKAAATRFKAEIDEKRTFSGIKATITSSDNPELSGKTEIDGTVTVEKVSPTIDVDNGTGGKQKITADLAYKITTDFGGPKATFALGMAPVVTYYISHTKKDLVANIADTTSTGGGPVVFIHP